jgi:hypothetical protein
MAAGGIELIPEVCLRDAEYIIDDDSTVATVFVSIFKVNDVPLLLRHPSWLDPAQSFCTRSMRNNRK